MKSWKSLRQIELEHEERVRRFKRYDRILYSILAVSAALLLYVWFSNNPL